MIQPTAYAHASLFATEGLSLILTNVATGETFAINGTTVEAWKGRKGITVRGYDERTGRYTQTVRHLSTTTTLFVGVMSRGYLIGGTNYVLGYRDMMEVFSQNV